MKALFTLGASSVKVSVQGPGRVIWLEGLDDLDNLDILEILEFLGSPRILSKVCRIIDSPLRRQISMLSPLMVAGMISPLRGLNQTASLKLTAKGRRSLISLGDKLAMK